MKANCSRVEVSSRKHATKQGRFYVGAGGGRGTGPPNVGQAPQIIWFQQ